MIMHQALKVNDPVLTQPNFCSVTGLTNVMVNNLVQRDLFEPDEIGGQKIKGVRLFSRKKAYEGRIIGELVKQEIPLSIAAKISRLATKGGWLEHWERSLDANRPFIPAFMVVTWSKDSYDAQII